MTDNRPREKITEALQLVKDAYGELIVKHEAYKEQIEDDTAFEQEELWLEDYQNAFLELETNTLDYIKLNVEKGKPELENEIENPSTDNNGNQGAIEIPPIYNNGHQNNHGETGQNENETVENRTETPATNFNNTAATASLTNHNVIISGVGSDSQASDEAYNHGHTPCGFKMENPKIPGSMVT